MSALLQAKGLYSKSRRTSGEEKEAVKAEAFRYFEATENYPKGGQTVRGHRRSDTLGEKLQTIRADEHEQQRKELMKNEHRRRSGKNKSSE